MGVDYPLTTVGDVSHRVTKGTTPTTLQGRFTERGIAFIKVEAISEEGRFLPQKFSYIDEVTNKLLNRSVLQKDDLLFTIAGTIGRVAIVDKSILPANTNQAVAIIRPDRDMIEPRYLYYALRDTERIREAKTRVVQSVQANFSLAELSAVTLPLPDVGRQRRIADILGSLDDKIELNRRMAATLEEMARALFKSWFVDFDPVRAKAEGRPTGLPPDIDALFPDELVESELGLIPKGWKPGSIKDLCEMLVNGSTPSRGRAEFWTDGTIPWFRTGELSDSFLLDAGEKITPVGYAGSSTKLLPRHSVVMAIYAAPTVGRLGITTMDATFNQAMTGMVPKTEIGPWFLFESLYCLRQWFNDRANGAAQQNISKAIVEEAPVVRPTRALLSVFNMMAEPLFMRREKIEMECKVLSEVRDTLLPKLISGEIKVSEIEIFAEGMNL